MLRFAKMGHKIIAFTRIRKHIGGEGRKQRRVRLFNHEGAIADLKPKVFQAAVMDEKIQRLDLPNGLREDAEEISEKIGSHYTPQEALSIFQGMIQDHGADLPAEWFAHDYSPSLCLGHHLLGGRGDVLDRVLLATGG